LVHGMQTARDVGRPACVVQAGRQVGVWWGGLVQEGIERRLNLFCSLKYLLRNPGPECGKGHVHVPEGGNVATWKGVWEMGVCESRARVLMLPHR